MENLPIDIALDILSRLPATSLMQIKCVSKSWRALARDSCLPNMHRAQAVAKNPSLILQCEFPTLNKVYSVHIEQQNSNIISINAGLKFCTSEYQIIGSCNGVLCLANALQIDPVLVCNPFAGAFVELPEPFKYANQEVALGFGYHPRTEEYKLVRIASYLKHCSTTHFRVWSRQSDVQVLTLGEDVWRCLGRPSVPWTINPRPPDALLNGALHWRTKRRNQLPSSRPPCVRILSFDLAEEKLREVERPACGSLGSCHFHLGVLQGCLSAVHFSEDEGIEIWLMKEYNVKESWSKDYGIGMYIPTSLRDRSRSSPEIAHNCGRSVRVVCSLKNGEILLHYEDGGLVLYNPEGREFTEVVVPGMPKSFRPFVHIESLLTVEEILGCNHQTKIKLLA